MLMGERLYPAGRLPPGLKAHSAQKVLKRCKTGVETQETTVLRGVQTPVPGRLIPLFLLKMVVN